MRIASVVSFGLLIGLVACVDPSNQYDPSTPRADQAKAGVVGVVFGDDGEEQALVADATVSLTIDGDTVEVTTGEDGAFAFSDLIPGTTATLDVRHAAWLRHTRTLSLEIGVIWSETVVLAPVPADLGDDSGQLTGLVRQGAQLTLPTDEQDHTGTVVEVDGSGLRTVTGPDGAFDFFLAPGTYSLSLSAPGHDPATATDVVITAGEVTTIADPIVLAAVPGAVEGTIVPEGLASDARDGVTVSLLGVGTATTGTDGSYRFSDVPAGVYVLTAALAGYDTATLGGVAVEPGRDTALPDLPLGIARGSVEGVVELSGRADHSGVIVSVLGTGAGATTAADGSFRVDGVPAGTWTLRFQRDNFITQEEDSVVIASGATTTLTDTVVLAPRLGDFKIDGGKGFTADRDVDIEFDNVTGVAEMRISEDQTFTDSSLGDTGYVTFAQSTTFAIASADDGAKTLYAQFKDADGTESALAEASIGLDTSAPETADLLINGGAAFTNAADGMVTLTLSAEDAFSGVAEFELSNDGSFSGSFLPIRATTSHTLADDTNDGDKTVYVRYRDVAGNVTDAISRTINLDRVDPAVAPTNGFTVDCGAATNVSLCGQLEVTLQIDASDAVAMYLSLNAGFPVMFREGFAASRGFSLPGEGSHTVYLKLEDAAGNISDAFQAPIDIDLTPPGAPSVRLAGGAQFVTSGTDVPLALSAAGATQMRVATDGDISDEPWVSYATSDTVDLAAPDGLKLVQAQFRDAAGNETAVVEDGVTLDTAAPTPGGTPIAINAGAAFARSPSVTLALDATGVADMRVAVDGAFDSEPWQPFAASAVALLEGADCTTLNCMEVCVLFRDAAGNVDDTGAGPSNAHCANITLDTTPPSIPVITTASQVLGGTSAAVVLASQPDDDFFDHYELVVDPQSNGAFVTRAPDVSSPPTFNLNASDLTAPPGTDPATAAVGNVVRIRAVDQAGNISAEGSIVLTVDTVDPATPTLLSASTTLNADNFTLLFAPNNAAANDATFSHYEIKNVVQLNAGPQDPGYAATGQTDGIVFALTAGDDVACDSPCENELFVRAVDVAGNTGPAASVVVYEDSTVPTKPGMGPQNAYVSATTVQMRLVLPSSDNGAEPPTYEIQGGVLTSYVEIPAAELIDFELLPDAEQILCVRGKDAARNVGTAECVTIFHQRLKSVTEGSANESYPDLLGDWVSYKSGNTLRVQNLRTGRDEVASSFARESSALGLNGSDVRAIWVEGNDVFVAEWAYAAEVYGAASGVDISDCSGVSPNCNFQYVAVEGDDLVVAGDWNNNTGVYWMDVTQGRAGGVVTLSDDEPRMCDDTEPDIANGVVVWCTANGDGSYSLRRTTLVDPAGDLQTFAAPSRNDLGTLSGGGSGGIVPAYVSADWIVWVEDRTLHYMTPLDDPSSAVDTGVDIGTIYGLDGDLVSVGVVEPNGRWVDVYILDLNTLGLEQITDDVFTQFRGDFSMGRAVWTDTAEFSENIYLADLGASSWVISHPLITAFPTTGGDRTLWLDIRDFSFWNYDHATRTESSTATDFVIVTGDGSERGFAVSGDVVAWNGFDGNSTYSLRVKNLANNDEAVVETSASQLAVHSISPDADRIAWADTTSVRYADLAADLTPTGPLGGWTGNPSSFYTGRIDVEGDVIVWTERWDNGGNDQIDIYCVDVTGGGAALVRSEATDPRIADVDGQLVLVYNDRAAGDARFKCDFTCAATPVCAAEQLWPAQGDNHIAEIDRSGIVTFQAENATTGQPDIMLHDLSTGLSRSITTWHDPAAPRSDPVIANGRVVFGDSRYGSPDVGQYELP
jgi:hypothetical protein